MRVYFCIVIINYGNDGTERSAKKCAGIGIAN